MGSLFSWLLERLEVADSSRSWGLDVKTERPLSNRATLDIVDR
jgi:hypothetical protein